ncbi:TetR/AcrR family transcriptional regulator C-terminal domain-containing protein [Carbonactinospora thermoautotrophica]|uniref:TetR/AcrR family transcriptional regulator C-terminal domain-containing protein n=1 Tax=Carbonactinospora thermoautotrophica TaxID=1469144 RepID=UPI000BB5121E|nr:TetR/AcrR family transcriptional regulator C-terminal domain-containing protein [Carbonactinospora thermoautotrophica]
MTATARPPSVRALLQPCSGAETMAQTSEPALSREQIVRAAVALLDAEGLDGLSMRRLGGKLGAGATTLYWHVANKDELLELALDEIMGELPVLDPDAPEGWRLVLAGYLRAFRAMIHRHPWAIPLFGTWPNIGPNALRQMEQTLRLLIRAGFSGVDLDHALAVLFDYVIGATATEVAWEQVVTRSGLEPCEIEKVVLPYLRGAAASYPLLARYLDDISRLGQQEVAEGRFDFGLEVLLDGLEARLRRAGNS